MYLLSCIILILKREYNSAIVVNFLFVVSFTNIETRTKNKIFKKRNDESIKIVPKQEHINMNIDWNINHSTVNANSDRVNKVIGLVIRI